MDANKRYLDASVKTAGNLRTIARSRMLTQLSHLSLPEVDAVVEAVARVIPAGNVPGVILNGLARLSGRKPPLKTIKRDINLLFRGVEKTLDKAVYGAFFAGPAAVIWGYQNLLKLAGKSPEDAFPEGVWQFYVDYALREDTARHTNETHGFDTMLNHHQIALGSVDRATAWVMAAIQCLHSYNDLLANEWRERVYLSLLAEVTQDEANAEHYSRLPRDWAKQRPYARGADAGQDAYPAYRRRCFDHFLAEATQDLPPNLRRLWQRQIRIAEARALPAYQHQMSIMAYLDPGPYHETRTPIHLNEAYIGLIHQGIYYLIPICKLGTRQPIDILTVRKHVAMILQRPLQTKHVPLAALTVIQRAALADLRDQLSPRVAKSLASLRHAPILLNLDAHSRELPLSELRQTERGIGDHALTCFDTGQTMAFDQSHVFFDGGWGAALAEIMTNEALSWAVYLATLPPVQAGTDSPNALSFPFTASDRSLIEQAPRIMPEVGAETDRVNLKAILRLRKLMKLRNDLIQLTVNDILILYRAIHAVTYHPAPKLINELEALTHLGGEIRQAAEMTLETLMPDQPRNPAILIPVDASQRSPRERLYPMTFEVPLGELDLINLHRSVVAALDAYENSGGDRRNLYRKFDNLQRQYLAALAGFGQVMSRAKEIANAGESANVGALKLLAHMPSPLQKLLDQVPERFNVLYDIIKGREVFSNLGVVAPTSTLTRFITAKDDNEKKILGWGVLTDAQGVMHVSLRDFRPHVAMLIACEREKLAGRIAQAYLDSYACGLNEFVQDLHRITRASRETRMLSQEDIK
jgi:hypothetical protein